MRHLQGGAALSGNASEPIGVFDSGIGGLTVLQAIRQALPNEDLIYVADTAHLPYGDKAAAVVRERASRIAAFLHSQSAKALIIACNTATAQAIDLLRTLRAAVPIIGVEPGVKPAALATQSGVAGILVTSATADSERFAELLRRHGQGVRFIVQPCPGLAETIEQGDLHGAALERMVHERMRPIVAAGADIIVLGCTHYSFVLPLIRSAAGENVSIVETGNAVARQLARTLGERNLLRQSPHAQRGVVQFFSSGASAQFQAALNRLGQIEGVLGSLPTEFV